MVIHMINEKIRKEIVEREFNETILFDNPSFDNSIIGYTDDEKVIYDYEKMIEEFAEENGCSIYEAIDFIDYNTVRSLPYAGDKAPRIMYRFME